MLGAFLCQTHIGWGDDNSGDGGEQQRLQCILQGERRTVGGGFAGMALPQLRADGTLPPGTHRATLTELAAAFDQSSSTTRPALGAVLHNAVALIRSRDPAAIIYVGGSYVTDKRDPSDIDLAVRSDLWTGTAFDAAFSAAHSSEVHLID